MQKSAECSSLTRRKFPVFLHGFPLGLRVLSEDRTVSLRGLLIRIRHDFDQYINLRPVKLLKGAQCPLKDVKAEEIDMTFIRENTEGEYSGQGAWLYKGQPGEVVIQDSVFSRKGTERVIRYAYELARKEHKTLTSVSKANALNYSMVFWDSIFKEVGEEYPDVVTHSLLVDAASMFMVKDPGRFQIVVTSNLFGDILTDLGAAIAGGMGSRAAWDWQQAPTSIRRESSPPCLNRSTDLRRT